MTNRINNFTVIRPDDGLNPPVTCSVYQGFSSIWKYWMQRVSWQTRIIRTTGTNVECQSQNPLGRSGGMLPWKLDSLKCNFLHSLDQNWLTGKVFKGIIKMLTKNEIAVGNLVIIIVGLQLFISYFINKWNNFLGCELPDVTCQTTRHGVGCPAALSWNKTTVSTWIDSLFT